MIQAVIFDVDGTLVDSVDLHAKAWQDAFRNFGHEIEFAKIRAQIGKGGDQLLPVFLPAAEIDAKGAEIEKYRGEVLRDQYLGKITAFADVRALLQRLKDDGVRIVLASSAKADELTVYKKAANIEDLVEVETSSDDAEKSKPHPDIFEAALSRLPGISAKDAIVVGDTPYDAEAAAKAGLRTIGVLCGGFPKEDLKHAGCVAIYADPADLLANYKTSPFVMSGA